MIIILMVTAAIDCCQMAESKRKQKTYVYFINIDFSFSKITMNHYNINIWGEVNIS